MSRIAGLYYPLSKDLFVHNMIDAVKSVKEWGKNIVGMENYLVGYTGSKLQSNFFSGSIFITLEGDIYQCEKGEIQSIEEFITDSYRKYGFKKTIQTLNGDFSLALYDHDTQTLWIARDRVGLKPLYYSTGADFFAFASRPKSLYQLPFVSSETDENFIARFAGMHYRYIDNEPSKSPYRHISQLPAGHYLRYKNGDIVISSYWELSEQDNWQVSENDLAEQYRELLADAVKIRLAVADKAAFTLSGGMDSSSVLASAVKQTGRKQHAFSSVYVDKTYDESDEIASMLDSSVEEWHKVILNNNPDVFGNIRKMVAVNDEPVATATWLSHYLLCEEVSRQGFGSLFGGLGGDELNAGEYEYFFFHFADLRAEGKEDRFKEEVRKWSEYHDHPIFKKNISVAENGIRKMTDLNVPGKCLPDIQRLMKYSEAINADFFDIKAFQPTMIHPYKSYLKNRTYQDIFYETAPCCLRAEDRQTLAFGLNNYVPFFDYRLLEFMFRIPGELKIRGGVTKILLRDAMKGVLPEETRVRIKKTGWNAPAHMWFSGKGLEELNDMVHSNTFRQRGIYNIAQVDKIIAEHKQIVENGFVKENHMMFLWQLVNLEIWLESLQ